MRFPNSAEQLLKSSRRPQFEFVGCYVPPLDVRYGLLQHFRLVIAQPRSQPQWTPRAVLGLPVSYQSDCVYHSDFSEQIFLLSIGE